MRVGLVVPHIFMHREILPNVIFSPAELALSLAGGIDPREAEITLYTPGPVDTTAANITADLRLFEKELKGRGDTYLDLLKKHPFTFVTLARQVQSEIIAQSFHDANSNKLDVVHVYTNEEDTALPFAKMCNKPVVFTHHDPYNFLVKYKSVFPKYPELNWISLSYAQRKGMPDNTNWVANIYHGIDENTYIPVDKPANDYVAYVGRIIKPKGLHLAIKSVREYNKQTGSSLKLKIAGKHYSGHKKDKYWQEEIEPELDETVEYLGFISDKSKKRDFLANAKALIVPSIFEEPFGLVLIEALACGTPIIGLNSGAIPEIINDGKNGLLVEKKYEDEDSKVIDQETVSSNLAKAIEQNDSINRQTCRKDFEQRFTARRMYLEHLNLYKSKNKNYNSLTGSVNTTKC